jgi:hypothetical protein
MPTAQKEAKRQEEGPSPDAMRIARFSAGKADLSRTTPPGMRVRGALMTSVAVTRRSLDRTGSLAGSKARLGSPRHTVTQHECPE